MPLGKIRVAPRAGANSQLAVSGRPIGTQIGRYGPVARLGVCRSEALVPGWTGRVGRPGASVAVDHPVDETVLGRFGGGEEPVTVGVVVDLLGGLAGVVTKDLVELCPE